jgi:putative molybdopterin biosynthesis protein
MDRSIYLTTVPIEEAVATLATALDRERLVGTETVPTHLALGRVTAAPLYAKASSPTFHSAAMDGYAVAAADTFGAREGRPLSLTKGRTCHAVNTGNVLPRGTDAVIMIEHVVETGPDTLAIEAPAFPWQHVRRIGEDIVATELIIPQHHELTPYDLGALLSGGIFELTVFARPALAVIPTGDEVLDFTRKPVPGPGQVIESNSVVLCALARQHGLAAERVPPVPDNPEELSAAVAEALASEAHIVVIGAGSSAGAKDYTRRIMERHGKVLVHGIAAMPGKPSLLGVAHNGKLLVGAPGYPVSAVVAFERLLLPLALWLGRRHGAERTQVPVILSRKLPSRLGVREFVRLSIGRVGDRFVGTPLPRGAGQITSLTKAQGVISVPEDTEGLEAGASVNAELFVPRSELDRTLVVVGSHDNTLDTLANELMGLPEHVRLASTHVGSMGGITALKSGSALATGAHLFDPESADFNFPSLAKYAPELELAVINLAIRHQGLIVAKGNPKAIRGVTDLAREGVTFINRQRGAGTRILLDYHLKTAGILPAQVAGYDKEESTHMAVAVNVLTGTADCGLGIFAAAQALGLDFVPLARERYDLLIPSAYLDDPRIATLLSVIRDPAFKTRIEAMGGYETTLTGQPMHPGQGLGT